MRRTPEQDIKLIKECIQLSKDTLGVMYHDDLRYLHTDKMSRIMENVCSSIGFPTKNGTYYEYLLAKDSEWLEAVNILEMMLDSNYE